LIGSKLDEILKRYCKNVKLFETLYMHAKLTMLGWQQLTTDNAVYCSTPGTEAAFLAINIDNMPSFTESLGELKWLCDELHLTIEMKEEDPGWIMGFHLIDDEKSGTVRVSHSQYLNTVLHHFKQPNVNAYGAVITPVQKQHAIRA
jgi:hypothetical protein